MRTFREVADIVSADLRPAVGRLSREDGPRLLLVLSTGDSVVRSDRTRDFFRGARPDARRLEMPGDHLDPLLRERCVGAVLEALRPADNATAPAPRRRQEENPAA